MRDTFRFLIYFSNRKRIDIITSSRKKPNYPSQELQFHYQPKQQLHVIFYFFLFLFQELLYADFEIPIAIPKPFLLLKFHLLLHLEAPTTFDCEVFQMESLENNFLSLSTTQSKITGLSTLKSFL